MRSETLLVSFIFGFCLLWDNDASTAPPIIKYTRGYADRVEYIYAEIHQSNLNTGTPPSAACRSYCKTLSPFKGDDAGHLIAARLGGTGKETFNFVPQNLAKNRGSWRTKVEKPIYDAVDAGNIVEYEVWPQYHYNTSTRPNALQYLAVTSKGTPVVSGTMDNPEPLN